MTATVEYIGSTRVVAATGATYRQLDYWVSRGYLQPANTGLGSGYSWLWSPQEVEVVRRMVALVGCGLTPEAAARAARDRSELHRIYTVLARLGSEVNP